MKNKVIAFITHTHQKKSNKTHTRNNTLTLVATVCVKKTTEQPELHQLTTKQQRKNIIQQKQKITQQ